MSDGESTQKLLYNPHAFFCLQDTDCSKGRTCCGAKGAMELMGHMRRFAKANGVTNIRINRSSCLDRCELGPIMVMYPEGVWYAFKTEQDVEDIVPKHIIEGGRVTRLMVQPSARTPADLASAS